jgi:hypothetical protein
MRVVALRNQTLNWVARASYPIFNKAELRREECELRHDCCAELFDGLSSARHRLVLHRESRGWK